MSVLSDLKRDNEDMMRAPCVIFVRCACGRIKAQGWVCPTVMDGGECEAGS